MSHKEPPFGFWIPVTDKDSAYYAAKMSGLPIFLLGFSLFLPVFAFVKIGLSLVAAMTLIFSLFLLYSGLRIRGGNFRTLPVSVAIWLVNAVFTIYFLGVKPATVMTFLIGLLALSGLRGWWYLRKRAKDTSHN